MTIQTGSGQDAHLEPGAVTSGRGNDGARAARREHRVIMFGIKLDAVARLLRNRRFQDHVITGVIALAALASLARENRVRSLARIAAWDRNYNVRNRRKARTRPA